MERVTRQNLETRVENVNRRMESRRSAIRYAINAENGSITLSRCTVEDLRRHTSQATVTVGTKREVADFLHAMMVALDDSVFFKGY